MTQDWHMACRAQDVGEGEVRGIELPGFPRLAVFNIDGEFLVTQDLCTHAQAWLSEGTVEGDVIECPFHGGKFDVRTGAALCRPPKRPLQTFDVQVVDDEVMVRAGPAQQAAS